MREALTLELGDVIIHATAHFGQRRDPRGIIFLNSGAQPRSSRGDLAVHVADSLAELGYQCFRVDLPGLGDSSGPLPAHYAQLYNEIQNGCHAEPAGQIVHRFISQFALREVFFFGLCGGAATGLFLAGNLPRHMLGGLLLFDLPFENIREYDSAPDTSHGNLQKTKVAGRLSILKRKLHDWLLSSRWEPQATTAYFALKRVCSRLRPTSLPPHANRNLLEHLLAILKFQIPVLLVSAAPIKNAPSDTVYFDYLKSCRFQSLHIECILGTTHSFVENGGTAKVLGIVTSWLAARTDTASDRSGELQPPTTSPNPESC